MIIGDLVVKAQGSWLSMKHDTGVVISSRARLARNLKNSAFPGWAGEDERKLICGRLREIFRGTASLKDSVFMDMGEISQVDRDVLKERHLISNELSEKGSGSALVTTSDEHVAIMINEEDHLRLQAMCPGLNMSGVWEQVDRVDSEIEELVDYAFSPELGYLTACPSNVGTGLRVSVMMHLPGLRLFDEIEPVMKGLSRIDLEVRGLFGEGTDAFGNMFQISNRTTLGESEAEILKRLNSVVNEMVDHEMNARGRLMEQKELNVIDHVSRAFGVLTHARILTSVEAVDLLSALRLGVELGVVKNLPVSRINEIMLLTQPGHLQKMYKKTIGPQERDQIRAEMVREKIQGVSLA